MGRQRIAASLCDVLLNTLSLDLVYVRMADRTKADVVEVLRTRARTDAEGECAARKALAVLADAYGDAQPPSVRNPFGTGRLNVAVTRFGSGGDSGTLIACSGSSTFPTPEERLLLAAGANQTAIVVQRINVEEQIRQQREWLRVTLASIGDGVVASDIEGRVTFLNAVAESLTGWTIAEAQGRLQGEVF